METKIVLQVRGVDLDDVEQLNIMARELEYVSWESMGGVVTATLYSDASDPVDAALSTAHAIEQALPGSRIIRSDEQLVSVGDIADRLGLTSEAVRLWSSGRRRSTVKPFPSPSAIVSQARTAMKLWRWGEVLDWLRSEYLLDPEPDVRYLSGQQSARLTASLLRPTPGTSRWETVVGGGCDRTLARIDEQLASNAAQGSHHARFLVAAARQ